jgi:hypothetical protein
MVAFKLKRPACRTTIRLAPRSLYRSSHPILLIRRSIGLRDAQWIVPYYDQSRLRSDEWTELAQNPSPVVRMLLR